MSSKRKYPIKRRTSKRAKEERIYRARVKEWLLENPYCLVHMMRRAKLNKPLLPHQLSKATQCHHKYGRIGSLLLWEQGWIPVSQEGHEWINNNPNEARELGLLAPKGQYNTQPKEHIVYIRKR